MNKQNWIWLKLLFIHACILLSLSCFSQCPVNMGFEAGSFLNWECSAGNISNTGIITLNACSPITGRHTLLKNTFPQALDAYGGFPVNCPNGSGYSIQLGNKETGKAAERVSYTFTIPADKNNYSIIYNYAVVFQNPAHAEWEQPKFTANVFDVSNNDYIGCSSFAFAASSNLPGFIQSTVKDSVFYKPWTPITIKLSGYAGKTIRIEFTTNDCTRGGHFGYAYVDINENCTSPVTGNTFCTGNDSISLIAPFGFSEYHWFPADFSKITGKESILKLKPIPPVGTVFAVELIPYPGQGCLDTIYTAIRFSAEPMRLNLPKKIVSCISDPVDLTSSLVTAGSTPGLVFEYYTNFSQTNYLATPKTVTTSGTYYIKGINDSGCVALKQLEVIVGDYPVFSLNATPTVVRPATIDLSSVITSSGALVFSYWKDSLTTVALANPTAINITGTYYVKGINPEGCSTTLSVSAVVNEPLFDAPNTFTPNGDGIHDLWEIPLLKLYPECIVEIYNRTGQQVFRSVGYNKPWDGKYNGNNLAVGTYYYIIKPSPGLAFEGGSITIIK